MSIINLSPKQLREAADLQERIQDLQAQLEAIVEGGQTPVAPVSAPSTKEDGRRKRKPMSPEGLANIRAAQGARWAAKRGAAAATEAELAVGKPKRKVSEAGRAAMAAAARARWAKVRGATKAGVPGWRPKRNISPALRKARSEALKARWAAKRAAGKTTL